VGGFDTACGDYYGFSLLCGTVKALGTISRFGTNHALGINNSSEVVSKSGDGTSLSGP